MNKANGNAMVSGELTVGATIACERHYDVAEIAAMWNLSTDKVRDLFEHEPDVLVIEDAKSKYRRRYRTLRIPESVLLRVHRRLRN